jgi:hypothetical protein
MAKLLSEPDQKKLVLLLTRRMSKLNHEELNVEISSSRNKTPPNGAAHGLQLCGVRCASSVASIASGFAPMGE